MNLSLFDTKNRNETQELHLRPHQEHARDAILEEWQKGIRSTLASMAVGSGKTHTFLSVLQAERDAGRMTRALIVAHREELIEQPIERMQTFFPDLAPLAGRVRAEDDDYAAGIVVGTIQTLFKDRRLRRVLSAGKISHLVIDEAHHGAAGTYLKLVNDMRAANPALRVLGVTATPRGGSGAGGLKTVFDSVAYKFSLPEAIRQKILCPFRALAIEIPVSFDSVRTRQGDYEEGEAGRVMSGDSVLATIVKGWMDYGEQRPTLAFAVTVAQAHAIADAFDVHGVPSIAVDGKTPRDERRKALQMFRDGEIKVLCNCAVFTEGVDLPFASCLVQARPTQSDNVYVQMAGRVLRQYPGKTDAIILDFEPHDARNLHLAGNLLAGTGMMVVTKQTGLPGVKTSFAVLPDGAKVEALPDELKVRVLDYLSRDPLAWHYDGRLATVTIGEKEIIGVQGLGSMFQMWLVKEKDAAHLALVQTWDDAMARVKEIVEKRKGDRSSILSAKEAAWRGRPATDKQKELLTRMGRWQDGYSCGEAAQIITHTIAQRTIQRSARGTL